MAGRRFDLTRFLDAGTLGRIVEQGQLALRLLMDARVPMSLKVLIPAFVAIYVVNPVDVIPDFVIGLGQLDDIGIVLAALALFVRLAPRHIVEEHRAAMAGGSTPPTESPTNSSQSDDWWRGEGAPAASGQTIDADYIVDGQPTGAKRQG